jgi:hypothetical protein
MYIDTDRSDSARRSVSHTYMFTLTIRSDRQWMLAVPFCTMAVDMAEQSPNDIRVVFHHLDLPLVALQSYLLVGSLI